MNIRVQRIVASLPAGFETLQAEARAEGHRMLDTLANEWASGTMRFNWLGEVLAAAYVDEALAGIGGVTLEPVVPGALRMRRFYIAPAYRRRGVGLALATVLLDEARRHGGPVTCNAASGSERFWEALGFVPDPRDGHTHLLVC